MKGLLLKDFYMLAGCCRSFLLVLLVFIGVAYFNGESVFFLFYPCLLGGMLPITLLSYDERDRWDLYSGTLPYSRAQLVSVKYLISLLLGGGIFVLTALMKLANMVGELSFSAEQYFVFLSEVFVMLCIAPAICFPCIFRFGAEKGRIVYYIVLGIFAGGIAVADTLKLDFSFLADAGVSLSLISCVIAGTLYLGSWYLSVLFYQRREL